MCETQRGFGEEGSRLRGGWRYAVVAAGLAWMLTLMDLRDLSTLDHQLLCCCWQDAGRQICIV